MDTMKRISEVFESSEEIIFDDSSRIVIMSDCHRGDGNWGDDFSKNRNPYFAALTYYYNKNYTYIELGDGDELWENKRLPEIINVHSDVFWLLSRFFHDGRSYFIYGNHDIVKRSDEFVRANMYEYFDERRGNYSPLFPDIKVHEGLILKYSDTGDKILLIHGHQADYINDSAWRLSRFLVRYLWRPLNVYGVNDPTRTAKNYHKKQVVEKKFTEWILKEGHMVIAGHTHRPMFPKVGEPPYFNDGSCVHPRCITAIEIISGYIRLIKWHVNTKNGGLLFIDREVLAGPEKLTDYFSTLYTSTIGWKNSD